MNCELAQEDIVLSVYGELPDDRVHRLDQHLAQCERCRQEMEAVSALQKAMTALPIAEPSPSLLARTRLRLDEALDAVPHGGFLRRMSQKFRRSLGSLQGAPVMATVLILAGVAGGGWGGYHAALRSIRTSQAASARNAAASVPVVADIDASQIALGLKGSASLPATDLNKMHRYYDLNSDVGGFLKKDKIWWYGSLRQQNIQSLLPNFPVKPFETGLKNVSAKATYSLNSNNKVIGYGMWGQKYQPNRLDTYLIAATTAIHNSADSTLLHDEITLIDHAFTRPWTVLKNYRRNTARFPGRTEQDCAGENANLQIGNEIYYLGAARDLMPTRKDQPPPDLKYFDHARK